MGPDDERVLAFDIKLSDVVITVPTFARLMGSESWTTTQNSFWSHDDWCRFPAMGPITSIIGLHKCIVAMGSRLVLNNVAIRKFKFELRDKQVIEGEFSMTVNDPGENITALLADMVTELIPVSVYEVQEDLPFAEASDEPPEEPLEWLQEDRDSDNPPLFEEALRLVSDNHYEQVTTSLLQRELRVGYNISQRLMEALQQSQVVRWDERTGLYHVVDHTDLVGDDEGEQV